MSRVFSKVARGQVWFIKGDNVNYKNSPGSVTAKSRPYLIVSCKENNLNSTTFNAVPISTGNDDYPMHVRYTYNGRPQVIQCEQIKTFDICDLKEYMYTLSDEIMNKVNIAIANQLELTDNIPSYKTLIDMVENIARVKAKEFNSMNQKVTDNTVQEIASKIQSIFNIDEPFSKKKVEYIEDTKENIPVSEVIEEAIQFESETNPISDLIPKRTPISNMPTRGKKKWNDDNKKKFLEDCEKYGPEDIVKIWGLKNKASVYQYKYLFKGEIERNEQKASGR